LKELKHGTSFTLKKKDYEDIISRLKSGNSILHDLAGQGCSLEPERQQRSQARLIKLLRDLARSLFQAISNATNCRCPRPHQACLELVPRSTVIVPTDNDDEVAKDFNFHIAFGTHETLAGDGEAWQTQKPRKWDTFNLKVGKFPAPSIPVDAPSTPIRQNHPKPHRRVGWASPSIPQATKPGSMTSTQTLVSNTLSMGIPRISASAPPQTLLTNLCRDLIKRQKITARDCHGYIADSTREFGLYLGQGDGVLQEMVTLRQLLAGEEQSNLSFDFSQKLKIALAISTSVLHLHKTPWITGPVTLNDFIFLKEDVNLVSGPGSLDKPFVAKIVTKNANHNPPTKFRPVNMTVLSLGALLTQVIIGKTNTELDMPDAADMDMNTILAKYEAGTKLSHLVLQNGGAHYESAVKWCFNNVFSVANLDNEEFCQKFYNNVVAVLEKDISSLNGLS
jgi:hypothetical protein